MKPKSIPKPIKGFDPNAWHAHMQRVDDEREARAAMERHDSEVNVIDVAVGAMLILVVLAGVDLVFDWLMKSLGG